MGDTKIVNGVSVPAMFSGNRASTRSTRKKKTQLLSPKKFIEAVLAKAPNSKSFEAGCAEHYKECFLDSPTFGNYWKESNKEKNFSKNVWLYDSTRVIIPEVDYYHASWVDGIRPSQYILAQAPTNAASQKDFFKMLAHTKAEGLLVAESNDEYTAFISSKFVNGGGGGGGKKSSEKTLDDVATLTIAENGVKALKAAKMSRWGEAISAVELVDMLEKARKFLGTISKGPLVITCKDGATRSGLVALLDTEADRLAKTGKVKHTETVKLIRSMRCNTFDNFDVFDLGVNGIIELCTRSAATAAAVSTTSTIKKK
ncbi:unnamed protein product [Caenorhabditis sp. 36 PRJEB53466]|nr:unnamed protein product [Caenorhabditis sp. 36 PRJEB53466]